ncbi:hypothetical protein [Geoalkalibacter ferrihydriticus]|nr:hypothetical protein [Geoalkalibacter ferrihydriticus]
MYFLKDRQGVLSPYEGKLEDLAPAHAAEIEEAFEVSAYFVQELTWVPAGKKSKPPSKAAARVQPCIVELTSGTLSLEEINPGELREDAAKIYPIDKHLLRKFVPIKVSLGKSVPEKKSGAARKAATGAS